MGEVIVAIGMLLALYVGFFYLLRWETKHVKKQIAKEEKQTELYECLLKKLEEDY